MQQALRYRKDGVPRFGRPSNKVRAFTRFCRFFSPSLPDTCWRWQGNLSADGYGNISIGWISRGAHKVAWEFAVGIPVPPTMTVDHLCRVRSCVNPAHLEVVTFAENVLRGISPSAQNKRKTHCYKGHEFTPENTRQSKNRNERVCRSCSILREERRRSMRQQNG